MNIRKNIYSLTDQQQPYFKMRSNAIKADGTYDTFIARHHQFHDDGHALGRRGTRSECQQRCTPGPGVLP